MLVTGHFIYLHLHKSAGTFINEALLRFVPGAHMLGYHLPRSEIPPGLRHLPVLGFVRNPWSYYVSWYAFQSGLAQPNHLFRCVSDDGRLGFDASIRRLLSLASDDALCDRVAAGFPDGFVSAGLNLPRRALAGLRGSGLGFYSFLYRHIYAGAGQAAHIGRTETLSADLFAFWDSIGFVPAAGLRSFVLDEALRNASNHAHYTRYYDADLAALVEGLDRQLIADFGYRFEPESGV